ncbi:WD40-repeat-containing domain protein [Neohortaea acidophila]|uniref:WD40-repeat-containing domain protein n=1 Tax=Neohortaea acidophila TaxID=245834 RepID=A0A6A6Q2T7_9PEZI|nr:WD40-repeat-containing domain protein [Neohortaea acidophila]KAF2486605.1 WD40-repeat-containing domain protein [Neohortaea acidophila]
MSLLHKKLYMRETADLAVRSPTHRKLYGDRRIIQNLDIVNELDSHTGCVNALSWSKSGSLLASGSDDQTISLHKYQPENSTAQFQLVTKVATGHTQNIFSVKFMPHSNDRTVVTAAGDAEVRIFDLEHTGASTAPAYLNERNTNCRVYRSHSDRVKRIVTESSPHLFLSASEDGTIRQFDTRQPSSAYPRTGRSGGTSDESGPPPLISYKRFQLDLNTISCSPSQPHYIVLGGAHLYALLHDRRMTGRDRLQEAGRALPASSRMSVEEEELMSQATRCVRKFAPNGSKTKKTGNGHITAAKISDSRPNEMIASWSGDHIYSFDLVRDPEDDRDTLAPLRSSESHRVEKNTDRKRKRQATGSQTSLSQTARPLSRPRIAGQNSALRINYQNGQSEDIPLANTASEERQPGLTIQQHEAQRIAKMTGKIRTSLFEPKAEGQQTSASVGPALAIAASILPEIDEAMRASRYPLNPSAEMVVMQLTLRENRESVRRFVQAAGTLARVLGATLNTPSGPHPRLGEFLSIEARGSDRAPNQKEQFGYDFLKAITLWIESGVGNLVEGFTRPPEMLPEVRAAQRLPIPASEATLEAIDEYLIPYLLRMARDKMVVNVETNRFEVDENRTLFATEKAAVLAFAAAVRIPFADLSSAVTLDDNAGSIQAQDRETARRYWVGKVARGVLLNAAEGVNYVFVDRAFGGLGRVVREVAMAGAGEEQEEDEPIREVELLDHRGEVVDGADADDLAPEVNRLNRIEGSEGPEVAMIDENAFEPSTVHGEGLRSTAVEDTEGEDDDDDNNDGYDYDGDEAEDSAEDDSEPDEEDGVPNLGMPRFMHASTYERRRMRDQVGVGVPCSGSIRKYRGHCNVRTVKDVNYFGLDDEYVVSGSDDGHLFMWDRKTSELVNVLEGDGETVNVVQGHPYEPMLAVSGIDHTIKIFSPDARAREVARLGEEVRAADSSQFSSLAWPSRFGRRRQTRSESQSQTTSEPAMPGPTVDARDAEDEDYVSPTGLASRKRLHDAYRIVNQNDVERRGGNNDAFLTFLARSPFASLLAQLGSVGFTVSQVQEEDDGDVPMHPFNQFS